MTFFMKGVSIRHITVDNADTSITFACWYGRKHPGPGGKLLKDGQSKSKVYQKRVCCSQNASNTLKIQEMVS